ncbi:MAG: SprT-like domain-containing protein, partial [Bacteroidota bacterium]|nr:SprT-like domain-containing protein [Bacteroidota bacterium]
MPKKEYPLEYLSNYIPAPAAPGVLSMLHHYKVHLTITRERKSVLGDYRHAHGRETHRISVNGNLNRYAFLITLVHELAHLVTFMQFGHRVAAHGKEWKQVYKMLLVDFLRTDIFPDDVLASLNASLHNLPASSCADEGLMRVLRRYDKKEPGMMLVEEIPEGSLFSLDDGTIFSRGKKLRKRFQCT